MALEVSQVNISSAIAHGLLMVVQSVMAPQGVAEDFVARQKTFLASLDSSVQTSLTAILGKQRTQEPEKQNDPEAAGVEQWQKLFGQRGNPEVEAGIDRTVKLLQDQIEEAKAAREAKRRARRKAPKHYRRL